MAPTKKEREEIAESDAPNFDKRRLEAPTTEDTVHVFTIDGQEYFIPGKPRVSLSLRYMRNLRKHGQAYAEALFLEEALGEEAHEALIGYEDLTPEDLEKVVEIATKAAFGGLEAPKATSTKDTRR